MYRLLTVDQIRELERRAVEEQHIDPKRLMIDAGTALADFACEVAPEGQIVVVCGPGNNGGDGWVSARVLHKRGRSVKVFTLLEPTELSGIAAEVAFDATSAGVHWSHVEGEPTAELFEGAELIIDAILGIGATLPLREEVALWCNAINHTPTPILSADVPTGVDADSGKIDDYAINATGTVTFLAPKVGLALSPGSHLAGNVAVADLGVSQCFSCDFVGAPEVLLDEEYASLIPFPAYDDNKYTRGSLLIVAGSASYTGAAVMSLLSATRSGAGYVTLATVPDVAKVARFHSLTTPIVELPAHRDGTIAPRALEQVLELAGRHDAIVIGPGLDINPKTAQFVRDLVAGVTVPVILDADGLNAFQGYTHELTSSDQSLVLTPHAGELARLIDSTADEINETVIASARKLAGVRRTVVLKGPSTIVACAERTVVDMQGLPVLATAGTGDVLTGIIGSLVAQGLDPHAAASLGVRLLAKAAAAAAEDLTPMCVTALEVIDALPLAVKELLSNFGGDEQ